MEPTLDDERPRLLTLVEGKDSTIDLDLDEVFILHRRDGTFRAMRYEGIGSWPLAPVRALAHEAMADAVAEMQASAAYGQP